jgi:hypothetical protein
MDVIPVATPSLYRNGEAALGRSNRRELHVHTGQREAALIKWDLLFCLPTGGRSAFARTTTPPAVRTTNVCQIHTGYLRQRALTPRIHSHPLRLRDRCYQIVAGSWIGLGSWLIEQMAHCRQQAGGDQHHSSARGTRDSCHARKTGLAQAVFERGNTEAGKGLAEQQRKSREDALGTIHWPSVMA